MFPISSGHGRGEIRKSAYDTVGEHGMRMEGKGNLFGYKGRGIISSDEGLDEVDCVGVEINQGDCRFTAPQMAKEKGMEHLVDKGWLLEK